MAGAKYVFVEFSARIVAPGGAQCDQLGSRSNRDLASSPLSAAVKRACEQTMAIGVGGHLFGFVGGFGQFAAHVVGQEEIEMMP